VDVYRYKDSTWLIFTDEARWVIELVDGGTLWYNYKFFNNIFKYVSMEDGYEKYITEWANDYFYKGINKTERSDLEVGWHTSEVINDGVKEVRDSSSTHRQNRAENMMSRIIQGGIKNTWTDKIPHEYDWSHDFDACKVIKEGVKEVKPSKATSKSGIHFDDLMCSGNRTDISLIVKWGITL
jgi:hypothetical protein